MGQLSYSIDIPAVSFPGQLADASLVKDVLSALLVAAAVPFGVFVCKDDTNTAGFDKLAAKVPASTGAVSTVGSLLGVVLAEQALAQDPSTGVPTWPINSVVGVLRKGRVWVSSETAVVNGNPVFVRFAANGALTQLGAVRADADTTAGPVDHAVAAPGCVFRGTYASAGFVVVELDLV